ncbi:MAG: universal stress protein [Halobacteriales archaeon]
MSSRILVAMDNSEMAERTLRYALETHPGAEITVIHVVGEPSSMWGKAAEIALADDVEQAATELAEDLLENARAIAGEYDREIETQVQVGHPARAIIDQADAYDLVVIGTHGGTLTERLLVGNVAETVFRRSPVPVTVVR